MNIPHNEALALEAIQAGIAPFGQPVSPAQADQIRLYISLLLKWNQAVSLTSVTEPHEILTRHFGESFYAASFVDLSRGRLADVGSGAGFPGLALKILQPELEVTLIESNGRKCSFLKEIARYLDLQGVSVVQQRLEQIDTPTQAFDFICGRAFGQFKSLLSWAESVLGPAGNVLLWLGRDDANDLSAKTGWDWREARSIPGAERRVILVGRPAQR
jgi:16S rRNA (guanine527-N7)-methyltransferase